VWALGSVQMLWQTKTFLADKLQASVTSQLITNSQRQWPQPSPEIFYSNLIFN